ncbi:uncharacterized protein LOC110115730 [Dendrobium catenatum]|uniref:Uncharacterized protein n=1 Tax=Dendrobium catenatum TaxID=906689 RepID=A0A2I0X5Y7_9ASPA|nr:uncharacterized protein LOC110115730 [Dendrobium catenatum]PKU83324.1 hypothetical protein MA16_Dca020244 [Dendrobium catenatum]
MDVWALNPKAGGLAWRACKEQERGLMVTRPRSQWKYFGIEEGNARFRAVWEVRVLGRICYRSLMVRATGQGKNPENPSSSGNNDPSFPRGDGPEQSNPDPDGSKSDDQSLRPKNILSDWRDFRASLVAREQVNLLDSDSPTHDNKASGFSQQSSTKWAHPLPMPETGCVLVATEKLDGVRSFERTVVLLLRSGTRDREEGPFGVIINRPLHKKIKHIKPSNPDLASTFADCSLNFGGPLDSSMFLLRTGETSPLPGLEQVIPGIRFGARNSLDEAAALVKKGVLRAQDFRFFVGYAGWQLDQLKEEIESDYWIVAACSSHLIAGVSADSCSFLWEEILQLMGGQYLELSKKPKQDSS